MDGDAMDFGNEPGLLNPVDMGGTPVVMPNNDDWASKFLQRAISSVTDIAVARATSGIAAPSGVLSSNPKNPPPGTGGVNMQAAATLGGRAQPFAAQIRAGNVGAVLLLAALVAGAVWMVRRL